LKERKKERRRFTNIIINQVPSLPPSRMQRGMTTAEPRCKAAIGKEENEGRRWILKEPFHLPCKSFYSLTSWPNTHSIVYTTAVEALTEEVHRLNFCGVVEFKRKIFSLEN